MFTLKQFLDHDLISWHRVLSSSTDYENRPIEHIAVIELPVEDFVRENEIILSGAVGCEEDESCMLELISGVYEHKACALILSMANESYQLPPVCLDYLRSHNLPVILIPWKCLFADLLEMTLNRLREDNSREELLCQQCLENLLTAYIRGEDLNAAARIIAKHFDTVCGIYDSNGNCRGISNPRCDAPSMISDDMFPISTDTYIHGYLWLKITSEVNYSMLTRYLMSPLILWFNREQVVRSAQQQERDDFVWELAKGSDASQEDIIQKGLLLGFDLQCPYSCIVGSIRIDHLAGSEEESRWITSNIYTLKEDILATAATLRRRIMLTYQQKQLIMFVEGRKDIVDDNSANRFLDALENRFSVIFPHVHFSWGVSGTVINTGHFREGYNHAKLALKLCPHSTHDNARFFYKDTVIFSILSVLAENGPVQKDIMSAVRPIQEYDQQNQSQLMHTLRVYLRQQKNISETARILSLHRQSLIYRLNKIEDITGLSLKDPENCFLLEIAIRMVQDSAY